MLGTLTAALLTCLGPTAIDGDTIRCANTKTTVRIWGIQAPEKGEPGFDAAKSFLQEVVDGGVVCEPKGTSYSRYVGRCYNSWGLDAGFAMVKHGDAKEWCSY